MELSKEFKVSSEFDIDIEVAEGNVLIGFEYMGKHGGAKLIGSLPIALLVDKLTDAIPGEWDDKLIDPLVAKLLAVKKPVEEVSE